MNDVTQRPAPGLPAKEFEKVFQRAEVLVDELNSAKSAKAKATRIGRFLMPNVNRTVSIEIQGRTGSATLCMREGRSKQRLYYFDVRWDAADSADGSLAAQADQTESGNRLHPRHDNCPSDGRVNPGTTAPDERSDPSFTSDNGNQEQW